MGTATRTIELLVYIKDPDKPFRKTSQKGIMFSIIRKWKTLSYDELYKLMSENPIIANSKNNRGIARIIRYYKVELIASGLITTKRREKEYWT